MITAEITSYKGKEYIGLDSDYPMRDKDRIKQMVGSRFTDAAGWIAPLTWAACNQLRGIFGDQLVIGPNLMSWALDLRDRVIDPALALRMSIEGVNDDPIIAGFRGKREHDLRPFQEAGVKFLATTKTSYLCDEMGTGKTAQTIYTMEYLKQSGQQPYPAIIIAPTTLTKVWEQEFKKWNPEVRVSMIAGNITQRRAAIAADADVYIINYETVRYHSRLTGYGSIKLQTCIVCDKTVDDPARTQVRCEVCPKELNKKDWKTIIVDEAHRIQEPKTKHTRAIWAVGKGVEFAYCLTGTAMTSSPDNLWGALHLMHPESFSNKGKYIDRYCDLGYNPFGGMVVKGLNPETKDELLTIIDPYLRRVSKKAVLKDLPDKTYAKRYIPMTAVQKKQYDQMKKGMLAELKPASYMVVDNTLTKVMRLDQMASAAMEEDGQGGYRMTTPSNKVAGLLELLDDMDGKPLVVFSASRQLIEITKPALDKADITWSEVVGGQTPDQRQKAVNDFQDGKVRVILCITGVGAEGLTLTRADTLCFMLRPWKMSQSKQSEDRIHRIGAEVHEKITIIDLITPGTIDETRLQVLAKKGDNLEEVMRDKKFLEALLKGEVDAEDQ